MHMLQRLRELVEAPCRIYVPLHAIGDEVRRRPDVRGQNYGYA